MVKFFIVLIAFGVFQFASCRVTRDAPAATQTTPFSDLAKQTEEALQTLHSMFLNIAGVKNDEEFATKVQTQGKTYADQLQGLVTQLGEEAKTHAGKADEVFTGLTTQLQTRIDDLKSKNPELVANAQQLETNFQENLQKVLKNTQEFSAKLKDDGKEISSNLENVLKQIYDNTLETAKKVSADAEAVFKANKSS